MNWYAVHTRSHHERKVRAEFEHLAFETYLPEYRALSRRRDRRKEILKPLFAGYLFVRTALEPAQRLLILQTKGVVRLVGVRHQPVPIPAHQVESIRLLLQGAPDASPCAALATGALVQVLEGPLAGVIGVVQQARKKKIVVTVELVGRAVTATLDDAAVAPYLDAGDLTPVRGS